MMPDEAIVVFVDKTDLWWLKFLRRGFRHCFVAIRFGDIWMALDGLSNHIEMTRLDLPDSFSLISWFSAEGYTAVSVKIKPSKPQCLWPAPVTCVELVKRILAIRKPFLLTPWQLYNHLKNQ